jgi:solute carrier family 6 amino acid transporter-like protein 5/7/9/14
MASFNKFNNNVKRDAIMVPIINCATSFYGGFAIFSVLGYMALQKGVDVSDVAASGPGLVFVAYPEALAQMPVAPLWSILFFLMMLTLGLSSMFSIVEAFFCSFMDEFPSLFSRTHKGAAWRIIGFRIIGCSVFYLLGLSMITEGGFYVFSLVDTYLSGFPFLIIGLLESIAICYIYGFSRFSEDVQMMTGQKPNLYFKLCLCVAVPIILLGVIIFMAVQYDAPTLFSGTYTYPQWAEAVGFLLVVAVLIWIPLWWIYLPIAVKLAHREKGILQIIKENLQPSDKWKPALKVNQTGRYAPKDSTPQVVVFCCKFRRLANGIKGGRC